jgi:hypothetical protein
MSAKPLCGVNRAASLCALAEHLYLTVGTVHGLEQPDWTTMSFAAKRAYYLEVEQLVARLKPFPNGDQLFDAIVAVARAEAAKVVGRITPSEPYGVDPRD